MICKPCQMAGRLLSVGRADSGVSSLHAQCPGGTWCDCQHETTPGMVQCD